MTIEFARKYGLPVPPVVLPPGADPATFSLGNEAYVGPGTLYNSEFLNGLGVQDGIRAAIDKLASLGVGKGVTQCACATGAPASATGAARSR